MTQEDFEALLPRLSRFDSPTISVARSVMVDGRRQAEAAELHKISRQRVNTIIRRVKAAAEAIPPSWRRIDIWLPPDLADEVEKMAADAAAAISTERDK